MAADGTKTQAAAKSLLDSISLDAPADRSAHPALNLSLLHHLLLNYLVSHNSTIDNSNEDYSDYIT